MTPRRTRHLVPILLVAALFGLSAVHVGHDAGFVDGAARVTSAHRVGDPTAVVPAKDGRVDHDRTHESRPAMVAPVSVVPADPASPGGGRRHRPVDARDDRWPVAVAAGSSRPRAPPIS